MNQLVWFRNDLRHVDNTALAHAAQVANGHLYGLFVLTPKQYREHDMAPIRVDFLLSNLRHLSQSLAELNIPLLITEVPSYDEVPGLLQAYVQRLEIRAVHANREYEYNEVCRDRAVEICLEDLGIQVHWYHDQCIHAPGTLLTGQEQPYKVFTPFKRAWLKRLVTTGWDVSPPPACRAQLPVPPDPVPAGVAGWALVDSAAYAAGESAARARLAAFVEQGIDQYAQERDFPAVDGTSRLSPYLALGILSPRQCLAVLMQHYPQLLDTPDSSPATWLNELIWREFYKHVLVAFARVSRGRAFKPETEALHWRNNTQEWQAWQNGLTGYPIVDAAMRQLKQTGWMHNRLRMIVASFLVKDLMIDWRWGEQYFMQQLIDGDLAANNGGWQWAASTGTDAAPYFRIFNPVNQGIKFDPSGEFIRKFLPELADVKGKYIHQPWTLPENQRPSGYPMPIVDHRAARERFLEAFATIRGTSKNGTTNEQTGR